MKKKLTPKAKIAKATTTPKAIPNANKAKKTTKTLKGINESKDRSIESKSGRKSTGNKDSGDNKAFLTTLLKSAGLKFTQGRKQVYDVLTSSGKPMTVESILASFNTAGPDRATVYRIVDQYVRVGIAKEVHLNDSVVRYEIRHGAEDAEHDCCCHHVVCTSCGAVEHVESEEVEKALATLAKKIKNFSYVNEHTLEFFGVCAKCSK